MNNTKKKNKLNKEKMGIIHWISLMLLILGVAWFVFKIVWAFYTSLKTRSNFDDNMFGIFPNAFNFENYLTAFQFFYVEVFTDAGSRIVFIEELILNSLLYALGGTFVQELITCLTAYIVGRFGHKVLSKFIYGFVIFSMIFPIVGSSVSELVILKELGLFDTILGIYILKANFLGIHFLIYHALFSTVAKEYSEAAYIDGAGELTILFRIVFPHIRGIFGLYCLFGFMGLWQDYSFPLIYLPTHPTVAYGLYEFRFSTQIEISSEPIKLAAGFLTMIPTFVLFLIFHKKFLTTEINVSGIKG